jgi:signal transduction histidine kinase
MSLGVFIRDHQEEIIREFAVFANTLMPDRAMSEAELRDHAQEMLSSAMLDMGIAQTREEQARKSRGLGTAKTMVASARLHADDRIQHGFSFRGVLAEFRALRATVLWLYEESGASDLSEVRRFNEAIDEALTESMARFAEQTDLFRDQFIGVLSHDLRAPLGAVTTGAALLAAAEDNPHRRGRVVSRIMSSVQRMERMISDLLDMTRVRLGGAIPLKLGHADLQQICDESLAEMRSAHPDAVVRLESSGNLAGDWDADRLAQVVSNLVGNAIQHGEGTPISISAHEANGGGVTLAVHNGGAPIPPDVMPFVFEPLARGRTDGALHSLGLGLFIARAVVLAHGGDIEVRSSSEQGTTFTVGLPKRNSN